MKAPQTDNELIHQDSLSPCLCVSDLFVQNRLSSGRSDRCTQGRGVTREDAILLPREGRRALLVYTLHNYLGGGMVER